MIDINNHGILIFFFFYEYKVFFVSGKNMYTIKKPVSSIITTSIGCMFVRA